MFFLATGSNERMFSILQLFPREYGYVVIVLVLYCFLNFYMAAQVGKATYLYASESENKDAKLFHYLQGGYQNSLDMMPIFFLLMTLGGLKHPYICAAFGAVYTFSRYFYFNSYSQHHKMRLKNGKDAMVALFVLMMCNISVGFALLRQPSIH